MDKCPGCGVALSQDGIEAGGCFSCQRRKCREAAEKPGQEGREGVVELAKFLWDAGAIGDCYPGCGDMGACHPNLHREVRLLIKALLGDDYDLDALAPGRVAYDPRGGSL